MPDAQFRFEIDDTKSFDANLSAFIESLGTQDSVLADVLKAELPRLLRGECDVASLWEKLAVAAATEQPQ